MTLTAAAGEIVGLAGIVGNGQAEFLRALAGLVHATGRAELRGTPLRPGRPDAALDAGVVYLSSDRLGEGLFGTLSVRENALVSALGQFSRAGRDAAAGPRPGRWRSSGQPWPSRRRPSTPTCSACPAATSRRSCWPGRCSTSRPALLLAEEPTQGVDVGARAEIYRILRQVAAAGAGVVIVSTDTRELEGLCDRVLVFSSGQVVTELRGEPGHRGRDRARHADLDPAAPPGRGRAEARGRRRRAGRPGAGLAAPGRPRRLRRPRRAGRGHHRAGRLHPGPQRRGSCPRST